MERILVVEDDPAHLLALEDNLKFAGYEVLTARSGRSAMTLLKQEKFDLVILDIMLNLVIVTWMVNILPLLKIAMVILLDTVMISHAMKQNSLEHQSFNKAMSSMSL